MAFLTEIEIIYNKVLKIVVRNMKSKMFTFVTLIIEDRISLSMPIVNGM